MRAYRRASHPQVPVLANDTQRRTTLAGTNPRPPWPRHRMQGRVIIIVDAFDLVWHRQRAIAGEAMAAGALSCCTTVIRKCHSSGYGASRSYNCELLAIRPATASSTVATSACLRYAYTIDKNFNFTVTADCQFIANPAYNADRGPAHIGSGRLHGEF
jgi:hypothetical protein